MARPIQQDGEKPGTNLAPAGAAPWPTTFVVVVVVVMGWSARAAPSSPTWPAGTLEGFVARLPVRPVRDSATWSKTLRSEFVALFAGVVVVWIKSAHCVNDSFLPTARFEYR